MFSGIVDFGLANQGLKKTILRDRLMRGSVSNMGTPLDEKIWRLVKRLDPKRHAVRESQHSHKILKRTCGIKAGCNIFLQDSLSPPLKQIKTPVRRRAYMRQFQVKQKVPGAAIQSAQRIVA